jgi:hypothetical protein
VPRSSSDCCSARTGPLRRRLSMAEG